MALAPIERLPPELIQPIFELSGFNTALPIASHYVAARLSTEHIYHATCSHWLTQYLGSRAIQSLAQSHIFAAKWMTWDFFQAWVLKHFAEIGCLCGQTPAAGCFDPIWPPHFEDATGMVFSRSHLSVLAYVKCRIPVKLLQGPWSTNKIRFLRFLLWTSSMTVDWADKATRNIAIAGRQQAIVEKNLEAVELFNHNRRLGKPPGLEQVRYAVIEGDCNRSIVYDTMATAWSSGLRGPAWECPILDNWCEERSEEPRAKWLTLKLDELRAKKGPESSALESTETTNATHPARTNAAPAIGNMDPRSGDYDDVDGDKLTIGVHRWNQELDQPGWRSWGLGRRLFPPRLGYDSHIIGLNNSELFCLYVPHSYLYRFVHDYNIVYPYGDLGSEGDISDNWSLSNDDLGDDASLDGGTDLDISQ